MMDGTQQVVNVHLVNVHICTYQTPCKVEIAKYIKSINVNKKVSLLSFLEKFKYMFHKNM